MTDLLQRLRAADPVRDELDPPPVETLLARIEALPPDEPAGTAPQAGAAPAVRADRRRRAAAKKTRRAGVWGAATALWGAGRSARGAAPALEGAGARRRGGRGGAGRRRRPLVPAIVAMAAVALVVGLQQRSTSPDVVAEARAALGTSAEVIHTVTRMEFTGTGIAELDPPILRDADGRRLGRMSERSERWTALDPLRERTRYTIAPEGGAAPHTMDITYADGVMRIKQSWMDELQTDQLSEEKYESMRGEFSPGRPGPDPVAGVRALLAGGELTTAGEQTLDGRRVLRLVGEEPHYGKEAEGSGATKVEYLVDASTFVPVRITYDDVIVDRGRTVGSIGRVVTFETFERLPATPANEALLRLP
jgi:hypothetical protein